MCFVATSHMSLVLLYYNLTPAVTPAQEGNNWIYEGSGGWAVNRIWFETNASKDLWHGVWALIFFSACVLLRTGELIILYVTLYVCFHRWGKKKGADASFSKKQRSHPYCHWKCWFYILINLCSYLPDIFLFLWKIFWVSTMPKFEW